MEESGKEKGEEKMNMRQCDDCGSFHDETYTCGGKAPQRMIPDMIQITEQHKADMVNHPPHYNQGKFETIEVIEDWNLNYNLGQVIKYISRCEHKGNKIEDLEKAEWYLKREIMKVKNDSK
jgi:hypothetical protein